MRIVVYRYQEAEGTSAANQDAPEPAMLKTAEQVYVDMALAAEPGYRPERDRLLADLQTNPADLVLVDHLADLGNDPQEVSTWVETLESTGAEVLSISGKSLDLDSLLQWADLALQQRRRLREGLRPQPFAGPAAPRQSPLWLPPRPGPPSN